MKYVGFEALTWIDSTDLNVSIGMHNELPANDQADVVYGKLGPRQTLTMHRHLRTDDGYESFFFFRGANLSVMLKGREVQEIDTSEPFHLTFYGTEPHSITNLSDDALVFEIICAPRHVD